MDCHLDTFFYVFSSSPDGVIKLPWQKWIIDYQGIQHKNVRTKRKTAKLGEEGIMVGWIVKEAFLLSAMKMWFGFNKQHTRKKIFTLPRFAFNDCGASKLHLTYAYIAGNKRCDENIRKRLLAASWAACLLCNCCQTFKGMRKISNLETLTVTKHWLKRSTLL